LGAGPMSSKMKTNFKKSAKSIKFLKNLMKKGNPKVETMYQKRVAKSSQGYPQTLKKLPDIKK
jgi:hypothetical protein